MLRHVHRYKVGFRIQIIFARFVYHAQISFPLGFFIVNNLIDLSGLQIAALSIFDAHYESFSHFSRQTA